MPVGAKNRVAVAQAKNRVAVSQAKKRAAAQVKKTVTIVQALQFMALVMGCLFTFNVMAVFFFNVAEILRFSVNYHKGMAASVLAPIIPSPMPTMFKRLADEVGTAIAKRAMDGDIHRRSSDDKQVVQNILTIAFAFEIIALLAIVFSSFGIYALTRCIMGRMEKDNPETQRADQVQNGHPEPDDVELGIIHARSSPHWPLRDHMTLPASQYGGSESPRRSGDMIITRLQALEARKTSRRSSDSGIVVTALDLPTRSDSTGTVLTSATNVAAPQSEGILLTSATYVPPTVEKVKRSTTSTIADEIPTEPAPIYELEAPVYSPEVSASHAENGISVKDWAYPNAK